VVPTQGTQDNLVLVDPIFVFAFEAKFKPSVAGIHPDDAEAEVPLFNLVVEEFISAEPVVAVQTLYNCYSVVLETQAVLWYLLTPVEQERD